MHNGPGYPQAATGRLKRYLSKWQLAKQRLNQQFRRAIVVCLFLMFCLKLLFFLRRFGIATLLCAGIFSKFIISKFVQDISFKRIKN